MKHLRRCLVHPPIHEPKVLDDVYLLRRVLGEIDHGALRLERRGKDGGAFLLRWVLGEIDQGSLRLERHESGHCDLRLPRLERRGEGHFPGRTMIPPKVLQSHCSADPKWLAITMLERRSQNETGIYISGSKSFLS